MGELGDLRARKTLGKSALKATETKGSFYAGRSLEEHHLDGVSRVLEQNRRAVAGSEGQRGHPNNTELNRGVFPILWMVFDLFGVFCLFDFGSGLSGALIRKFSRLGHHGHSEAQCIL